MLACGLLASEINAIKMELELDDEVEQMLAQIDAEEPLAPILDLPAGGVTKLVQTGSE